MFVWVFSLALPEVYSHYLITLIDLTADTGE